MAEWIKNCHNCKHLEWGFGDVNDPEGWMCNKRDYKGKTWNAICASESKHQGQLENEKYRNSAKKCCELKAPMTQAIEKGAGDE